MPFGIRSTAFWQLALLGLNLNQGHLEMFANIFMNGRHGGGGGYWPLEVKDAANIQQYIGQSHLPHKRIV